MFITSSFVISELSKCNILLRESCNLICSLRHKFENRMDKRDVLKFSHITFYVSFVPFVIVIVSFVNNKLYNNKSILDNKVLLILWYSYGISSSCCESNPSRTHSFVM